MSALAGKLRALRQQAGSTRMERPANELAAVPTRSPPGRLEASNVQAIDGERQRAYLRRLLGLRERGQAASAVPVLVNAQQISLPAATLSPAAARHVGAVEHCIPEDARLHRSTPDRHLEGDEIASGLMLQEQRFVTPAVSPPDCLLAFDAQTYLPANLLFFDTETTGLAGGTGTRAFMIGVADFIDDQLRIRQLTLKSMAAETAMLAEFSRWLQPDSHLVSYNGRCYDAPLLSTRYRLARLPNPLTGLAHLDLLHPVRRRYRGRWENCRMATIERQLLGIVREDDLPGSQAPLAWRSYLRGGSAVSLRRVAEHNAQDLKSLAALLIRLCQIDASAQLDHAIPR